MAFHCLRDSGFINGRSRWSLARIGAQRAGEGLHSPLPDFGSYLVIFSLPPWPKPLPPRFGDLSYGLYIYGWPIGQAIVWLNGGAMSWWA